MTDKNLGAPTSYCGTKTLNLSVVYLLDCCCCTYRSYYYFLNTSHSPFKLYFSANLRRYALLTVTLFLSYLYFCLLSGIGFPLILRKRELSAGMMDGLVPVRGDVVIGEHG
jgi:hypothetical protein